MGANERRNNGQKNKKKRETRIQHRQTDTHTHNEDVARSRSSYKQTSTYRPPNDPNRRQRSTHNRQHTHTHTHGEFFLSCQPSLSRPPFYGPNANSYSPYISNTQRPPCHRVAVAAAHFHSHARSINSLSKSLRTRACAPTALASMHLCGQCFRFFVCVYLCVYCIRIYFSKFSRRHAVGAGAGSNVRSVGT